jgi:hypothetical protein
MTRAGPIIAELDKLRQKARYIFSGLAVETNLSVKQENEVLWNLVE